MSLIQSLLSPYLAYANREIGHELDGDGSSHNTDVADSQGEQPDKEARRTVVQTNAAPEPATVSLVCLLNFVFTNKWIIIGL